MNPIVKNHLQQISKDPAFWVIFPLTLIIVPHFSRLPIWMPILILCLFLWRLLAILNEKWFPRKWMLFVIVFFAAIGTVMHYRTLFGKSAGTAILICLLGLKLLESRNQRDFMLIIALSFFIIVTNFLFSQTIFTALYMLFTVVLLTTTLITINQNDELDLFKRMRLASKMVILALPLMLVMFVLFPRISGPLWNLPDDAKSGRTGMSDKMSPGSITNLIESDEVAFRVEFESKKPSQDLLYWRGIVLWYFDGRGWEPGNTNENPVPELEGFDKLIQYSVTLEPHDKYWLFALDMPASAPDGADYTNNYVLRTKTPVTSLYHYKMEAFTQYRIENELSAWEQSAGLKLPLNNNPRTIELGQKWRQELKDDELIIRHALKQFNQQNYIYTLEPPPTLSKHPVDEFLFETRRGFCEHYASSFAVLMRAAGIPARIVLGYQGGTENPLNNVLTVRQSDAHAWTEVWLKDRGWIRIDPTAAIAPNRIEHNLDAALSADETRPFYMQINNSPLRTLKFYWDAMDNRWKKWVIGYGPKLQQHLMRALFDRNLHYNELAIILIVMVGGGLLVATFILFKSDTQQTTDPVQKLYIYFCTRLARRGLVHSPHEGPLDFAAKASSQFPKLKDSINMITTIYINARYRSRENTDQLKKMKQLIRNMKFS